MCAVELCCDTGASGETVLRGLRASVCRRCRTFAPWPGPPSSTSEDTGSLERKFQVNPLQLLILSPHTAAWLGGRGAQRDTQECRCCCACRGRGWETPSRRATPEPLSLGPEDSPFQPEHLASVPGQCGGDAENPAKAIRSASVLCV